MLSVQGSNIDVISLKSWEESRDITCLICGPNPAIKRDQPYSQRHYDYCVKKYEDLADLAKYRCIFIDNITVASRLCLEFVKTSPDVLNTKTGRPDLRSAYGILASEILNWVNQFQHLQGRDVIFIGGLDQKLDDFYRTIYSPQAEGSKIAAELPGIFDEVITMTSIKGTRKLNLYYLSPKIKELIIDGKQPQYLKLQDIIYEVPLDWNEQESSWLR